MHVYEDIKRIHKKDFKYAKKDKSKQTTILVYINFPFWDLEFHI